MTKERKYDILIKLLKRRATSSKKDFEKNHKKVLTRAKKCDIIEKLLTKSGKHTKNKMVS